MFQLFHQPHIYENVKLSLWGLFELTNKNKGFIERQIHSTFVNLNIYN